jgi:hypothetical protein
MVTSFYYIKETVRNRKKPLAHPHFSICKKLKAQEAWSGLLERIHRPPLLSKNNHRSLPDRGKHGEAAE